MDAPRRQTAWILSICVLVTLTIFAGDLFFPLGVAGGVPYVALVLLGMWLPWRRSTFVLAAIASGLVVAGYFLSQPHSDHLIVVTNRVLAIAAIWITATLSYFQKDASQRARDDEAQYRAVTDTAIDAILVIDTDGIVQMVNPACERLFGYRPDEIIGHNVNMLMPSPDRERHGDYLRRYLETGERRIIGIGREVTARRRDGTQFPIHLSVGEASLSGRRMFTGFVRDITDRKQAELRVRELQSELYRAARLGELGEMAAAIAHELNQPLTAVTNYVEAARHGIRQRKGSLPDKIDEMMEKAAAQARRAGEVIRYVRAMAGREQTKYLPEDLNAVVEEAAGLALIDAESKGISAILDLAPDLPPCPMNRTQIQQVLLNLVRNGVDAMEASDVRELTVRTLPDGERQIEVSVADTGTGLPEEVRAQLFKPFVTTKSEGMGIGLSISRSIIDAHGGRLWVEDKEGGGTVFHFTLPARDQEEQANGGQG